MLPERAVRYRYEPAMKPRVRPKRVGVEVGHARNTVQHLKESTKIACPREMGVKDINLFVLAEGSNSRAFIQWPPPKVGCQEGCLVGSLAGNP